MTMKKLLTCLILCASLLALPAQPAACASEEPAGEAERILQQLGLLRGDGEGFASDRPATRAEATVMLLRLAGEEAAAEAAGISSPFADGGWADTYLGYANETGLVRGVAEHWFDADAPVSGRDYVTMVLRVLGYAEDRDFTWQGSLIYARGLGLVQEGIDAGPLVRRDMAEISCRALTLSLASGGGTLLSALRDRGAVDAAAAEECLAALTEKPVYSGEEIYDMCAPAVLCIETYETQEDLEQEQKKSLGSAFLISADGLAVLDYHEIDNCDAAVATTQDGRRYPVTGVVHYDPFWDIAVVRLGMTDTAGQTRDAFPYLPLGDSDTLRTGEPVYVISNPMSLDLSFSQGVVSRLGRVLDDPEYPAIQTDAATSQGSSGGPMFNRYGEVVGVVYGSYTTGQMLNFMIPVSSLRSVRLDAAPITLKQMRGIMDARKAAAVITAEKTALTLKEGERETLVISSDYPGTAVYRFDYDGTENVELAWGEYVTKQSVSLNVTGVKPGNTSFVVTFTDDMGNETAKLQVRVTVTQ